VILAVILTLLKVDRCFTMLTVLQKCRKRLSTKVFDARIAKGVNRLKPPFSACKTPIRRFDSDTRLQPSIPANKRLCRRLLLLPNRSPKIDLIPVLIPVALSHVDRPSNATRCLYCCPCRRYIIGWDQRILRTSRPDYDGLKIPLTGLGPFQHIFASD
jgi:hypothetical protein